MSDHEYALVENIIKWEAGNMPAKDQVTFFCYLLNKGILPSFHESYQRYAKNLVRHELILVSEDEETGNKTYSPNHGAIAELPSWN